MPVEGEDREAIHRMAASSQNTHAKPAWRTIRHGSPPSCSGLAGFLLTPQSIIVRARTRGKNATAAANSVVSNVGRIPPTASLI